jgi:hypothetical protein
LVGAGIAPFVYDFFIGHTLDATKAKAQGEVVVPQDAVDSRAQ